MTGDVEEAILEMYLSGISVRKIAGVTDALSKVRIGKDAVSRIASRLEEQQKEWRERSLEEKEYPYLYLDATYLKVRWGARVTSMALLAAVGVDEEGFRELSWRWRWLARRREPPTPHYCGASSTGASRECVW
jgi:putative transposase